jgi:CDGSH-type Zn-finger protein/truncated hemoglobin YjbI
MTAAMNAGRGALANVIATRGGRAAPEAPFVIEHREALIYMLCEAAELEHAIMCQYLYAGFSLKQDLDEGLTPGELAAVLRWRKAVSHIATQEMLHLALVQNLLSAVGAAPHLSRPNLPQPAGHYPPGVVLTLLPFGEQALRHFMFLERPEGMEIHDTEGMAATDRSAPIMQSGEIVPRLQDFATVGHLYRSIEEGIRHLSSKYGEEWLFIGPSTAQAAPPHFPWPELVRVTDANSAQRAVDTILDQGEGPRGEWRTAHFGQFVEILDEYRQLKQANPEFEPARPVIPATVRPGEGDREMPLITDQLAARVTDLFNVGYEVLLQSLARYFTHTEETDDQLATLAKTTLGIMFDVVKPLGDLITTLLVAQDRPGACAGPSFELFYESDYALPHRDAAWALIEERLREAATFADRTATGSPSTVASVLARVSPALLDLAHSLASERALWGGASHAGEVTVAHRRTDAARTRSDPVVAAQVQGLTDALHRAIELEQENALATMLVAADARQRGRTGEGADTAVSSGRDLAVRAAGHFGNLVDLTELCVAIEGETEFEPPEIAQLRVTAVQREQRGQLDLQGEFDLALESVEKAIGLLPAQALIVDPRPTPPSRPGISRVAMPTLVDMESAVALVRRVRDNHAAVARDLPDPAATDRRPTALPAKPRTARGEIADLFAVGYQTLLSALGRCLLDDLEPGVARGRLRDIAARLWSRVLVPLVDAMHNLSTDDAVIDLEAARRRSLPSPRGQLGQQLQSLTVEATRVSVSVRDAPPELIEAVAGLQHLALDYGFDREPGSTEMLDRCRVVQSASAQRVQVAKDGPYLLTNTDAVRASSGEAIPIRPTTALCRCGQSSVKPWCDGTHRLVQFSGAKDPNRVPDRRDAYSGVSITVLDNRGICQHSGLCTDRIPSAFRVDQEPFVAPSSARMDEIIQAVRNCPSGALSLALDGHEYRDIVDWHGTRPARLSVTKDGPYRVSGGIPLVDESGRPVERNEGVSLEHYALCRCGHSRNKPFCSGMHWYVAFRDPEADPDRTPTLFEWCGGLPALQRTAQLFFGRYMAEDPLLSAVSAGVLVDEPERVASWLGEALGGPPFDTERFADRSGALLPTDPLPTEEQRCRWVTKFCEAGRLSGLAAEPEFWSALAGYLDWRTRRELSTEPANPLTPLPIERVRWDWGPTGPPRPPDSGAVGTSDNDVDPAAPLAGEIVSFESHIKPLFREKDRQSMSFAFDLWRRDDVRAHASGIIGRLRAGTMPCDGPWDSSKTDLFQRWIDEGMSE